MTTVTGTKRTFTSKQVARFKAIQAGKTAKPQQSAETPKGDVVKMRKYVLQDVQPFDAMIGFTESSRGMTQGDNPRPYTTLKGVDFMVDGTKYTRTCMAYGEASVELNKLLDAGETMLEVQLTPNFNTMKISGLVVEGTFKSFEDERPATAEVRDAA